MKVYHFIKNHILGVILGTCTIVGGIVAVPTIYYWVKAPQATIKLGSYELENNKKIVLHYILPIVDKQTKSILPFPLVLSNETESDIRNFYLQIRALPKEVIIDNKRVGLGMKRILEFSDYSREGGSNQMKLLSKDPDKNSAYQRVDNQKDKITLYPDDEVSDFIMLNAVDENNLKNENPWDAFSLELDAVSRGKEEHFNIMVMCYYSTNIELTTEQIRQSMNKNATNIVLAMELEEIVVNKRDGSSFGRYVLSETNSNIIKL